MDEPTSNECPSNSYPVPSLWYNIYNIFQTVHLRQVLKETDES